MNSLNETQVRLLDAAEILFAEKGFEAVSLRDITQAADANVAAVSYHFGGKENLINAVMGRHAMPINCERIERLDQLLAREQKPTVREVVDAFLRPLMERILDQENRQQLFAKFMARMMGEKACGLPAEVLPQFQEMARKVVAGFQAAVPSLSEEQAYFRLKFCFAVMADAMMRDEAFEQISEGRLAGPWNWEQVFEEVLDFCEGGLKG
ncbi:MAG: TetR/AcrR family transcriptional regulator [Roseibacillus sp.]